MAKLAGILLALVLVQNDVIRVDTRLVEVNVVVRDKTGPVANLSKDDFTVLDNKKEQRIEVFSVLDTRKAAATPGAVLPTGVIANRVNANGQVPATATVILFDLMNMPTNVPGGLATSAAQFQSDAIKELIKYLRTVRKEDRVALYLFSGDIQVIQDFTGDPEKLLRAAARIKSMDVQGVEVRTPEELIQVLDPPPIATEPGVEPTPLRSSAAFANALTSLSSINQAVATSNAFEFIAKHLSGLPGRKNLIWMSGGFPFSPPTVQVAVGDKGTLVRETPTYFDGELARASRALNNANIGLYPVDVRGLAGTYPEVMLRLSDATGGRASYYNNDLQGAVRSAVSDGEVSYTLGFYSTAGKSDKSYHNLSVKVNRKDTDVRHRAGYYPMDTQTATTDQQRQVTLGEALGSPLNVSDLGLVANAVRDPSSPGRYKITLVVDARDIQFNQQNGRRTATLILATRPESSKAKTIQTNAIPLSIPEDQFRKVLTEGFVMSSMIPGTQHDRLRLVVQDKNSGAVGSLSIPLD